MKMRMSKKGQFALLVKIIVVLALFFIVLTITLNLFFSVKRSATQLIDKQLDEYDRQAGSLIHPDLAPEYRDFWFNNIIAVLKASSKTDLSTTGGGNCHGLFSIKPDVENAVNGYYVSFLQQGNDVIVMLHDPKGVLAAMDDSVLKDKNLCLQTWQNGKDNAFKIYTADIYFGEKNPSERKSQYYKTEDLKGKGTGQGLIYEPYEIKKEGGVFSFGSKVINTYYLFQTGQVLSVDKAFCLITQAESQVNDAHSKDYLSGLLDAGRSDRKYESFCNVPDREPEQKECYYTSCADYDKELTNCLQFSMACHGYCYPTQTKCEYCSDKCDDANDVNSCTMLFTACGVNCIWKDNKCISTG